MYLGIACRLENQRQPILPAQLQAHLLRIVQLPIVFMVLVCQGNYYSYMNSYPATNVVGFSFCVTAIKRTKNRIFTCCTWLREISKHKSYKYQCERSFHFFQKIYTFTKCLDVFLIVSVQPKKHLCKKGERTVEYNKQVIVVIHPAQLLIAC